jgi:hypothetical protein
LHKEVKSEKTSVRIWSKIAFQVKFSVPRPSPQNAMRFAFYLLDFSALFLYLLVVEQQPADVRALNSFKVRVVTAKFQFIIKHSCKTVLRTHYVCYCFLHMIGPAVLSNGFMYVRSPPGNS